MSIVFGFEHECLPYFIEVAESSQFLVEIPALEGLSEHGADDVHHGVIG